MRKQCCGRKRQRGRKWQCGRKWRRDSPPAPVSRAHCSTFPAGFRVHCSQGSPPDRNLGCSTAPSYVPSHPARTPHLNTSSAFLHIRKALCLISLFIHRTVKQFRLEGTSKGLQSNLLSKAGSAIVAQGFIQSNLETLQGQTLHSSSDLLSSWWKGCSCSWLDAFLIQAISFSLVFSPHTTVKSLVSSALQPLQSYQGCYYVCPKTTPLQTDQD